MYNSLFFFKVYTYILIALHERDQCICIQCQTSWICICDNSKLCKKPSLSFGKLGCGNLACEIGRIDLVMFAIEILLGSSIAGHFYLQPKLDCWTFLFAFAAKLDCGLFGNDAWLSSDDLTISFATVTFAVETVFAQLD